MKKRIFSLVMTLSLFGVLTGVSVHAQGADVIEANIPFKFTVEGATLPAGKYFIRRLFSDDPTLLVIQSEDNRVAVEFLTEETEATQAPNEAYLVFNVMGDQHFLSQIWSQGSTIGRQRPPSRAEKRLEKTVAKKEKKRVPARHTKRYSAQTRRGY